MPFRYLDDGLSIQCAPQGIGLPPDKLLLIFASAACFGTSAAAGSTEHATLMATVSRSSSTQTPSQACFEGSAMQLRLYLEVSGGLQRTWITAVESMRCACDQPLEVHKMVQCGHSCQLMLAAAAHDALGGAGLSCSSVVRLCAGLAKALLVFVSVQSVEILMSGQRAVQPNCSSSYTAAR